MTKFGKLTIGGLVKAIRQSEGWTEQEMEFSAKLLEGDIYWIERDVMIPPVKELESMAVAWGYSGELFNELLKQCD